jgi:hypothetical protein
MRQNLKIAASIVLGFVWVLVLSPVSHGQEEKASIWTILIQVASPGIPPELWRFRFSTIELCEGGRTMIRQSFRMDNSPFCRPEAVSLTTLKEVLEHEKKQREEREHNEERAT